MTASRTAAVVAVGLGMAAAGSPGARAEPREVAAPIQDNSFLIEEAYNQERGVVQHISSWTRFTTGREWLYAFTQEWPAGSQRHQLSYTVPFVRREREVGSAQGLSDVALHYRYQWAGGRALAVAPRISVLLATGDQDRELGAGAPGIQVNLPSSLAWPRGWVAHTNLGASYTWSAGGTPARRGVNLGQSLVWLVDPTLNVLVELAWDRSEAVGVDARDRSESLVLSPGVRWAHDFPGSLQVVPGIAFPIGIGAARGRHALLLYLSFEHGF